MPNSSLPQPFSPGGQISSFPSQYGGTCPQTGCVTYAGLFPYNYGFNSSKLLNFSVPPTASGCGPTAGSYLNFTIPASAGAGAQSYTLRLTCRGRSSTPDAAGSYYYPYTCARAPAGHSSTHRRATPAEPR